MPTNESEIHLTQGRGRFYVISPPSLSAIRLGRDLRILIQYRDLLYTLSLHRIKVRYKQSVLGGLWAILQPLSLMLMFTFVFRYVTTVASDGIPYAVFAYSALLPWNYFSSGVSNATNSLVSNTQFVTKVYFPREILPATYVIAASFDFVLASVILIALMAYYHIPLTINALYAIPIIVVLTCFSLAISLFLSATQVRFRDIGVAVPLLLQLWLFATPVIYPLSAVPARYKSLYMLNPMVGIIENFRQVLIRGTPPDFWSLFVTSDISIPLLVVSYVYFKRIETTMADFI
ncbi:MAG TPA: ABC transporter permease [Pyrinomonadaceae bacterium]